MAITGPGAPLVTGGTQRTVSDWAAPTVGGLVTDAVNAYKTDVYQPYTGAQVAGQSDLQTQAFAGLSGLATPSSVTAAEANLANIYSTAAGGPGYTGTTFTNQYVAPTGYNAREISSGYRDPTAFTPTTFTSGYNAPAAYTGGTQSAGYRAPTAYQTGRFEGGVNAPGAYQATQFQSGISPGGIAGYDTTQFQNQFNYTPAEIVSGLGDVKSVEGYMNPYLQSVVDAQAREARRQSEFTRIAQTQQLAKAGAYGGSRQAMLEAEGTRNLQTQLGDITAKGYQSAYDTALQQRLAESAKFLEAQKATEANRQFGAEGTAKYGLEAARASELSKQYGYGKGMEAQELQAKYGMEAQKAEELSRQFGYGKAIDVAELQTKYGLDAAKAAELSRQFGSQQAASAADTAARYRLEESRAAEQARQFGYGQRMEAARTGADIGLRALSATDASRQFAATNAANIAAERARLSQSAATASEAARQEAARQAQTSAASRAQYGLEALRAQEASKQFGAGLSRDYLQSATSAAQAQGSLGIASGAQALARNQALASAGATQRDITQQGLTADFNDFLREQNFPAAQRAALTDLITKFPMTSENILTAPPNKLDKVMAGGATGYAALRELLGNTATSTQLADMWKSLTGQDPPAATTN